MSYFQILKAGILTTMQDLGRFGYGDIGISSSGAMDEEAFLWANKLLGNEPNSNMLEITYGNFELLSFGSTIFCITGAKADIWLNNKLIEPYRCYKINRGDRLKIGFVKRGVRLYFAIKGAFLDTKELGSYSVSVKESIKSPLKNGDRVYFKPSSSPLLGYLPKQFIPPLTTHLELRVLLGYEYQAFAKEALEHFFNSTFKVHSHSRMGYRLKGALIESNLEIISNPISFGAIQITKSGEPIILLKERQTIGGYPKIGSVIALDCFKLAQLKEGDTISFRAISLAEASEVTKQFYQQFINSNFKETTK